METRRVATGALRIRAALTAVSCLLVASAAFANHHVDCTISGGTNGPGQLDCRLPDFVIQAGSQSVLTSAFVYTASTDQNPVTCRLGTLTVDPVDGSFSFSFAGSHDPEDVDATLERLFRLLPEIAAERKRPVVLMIDEFQEIVDIDQHLTKLLRSVSQRKTEATAAPVSPIRPRPAIGMRSPG